MNDDRTEASAEARRPVEWEKDFTSPREWDFFHKQLLEETRVQIAERGRGEGNRVCEVWRAPLSERLAQTSELNWFGSNEEKKVCWVRFADQQLYR